MPFWSKRKRAVTVMNGRGFVAAYSEHPFAEARARHPDYTFHEQDGTHWCIRVGDLQIPWGFCTEDGLFANGVATVSRMNVNEASFTGRGLPYVREGEIFYLYESYFNESDELKGFAPFLRERLAEIMREIAAESGEEGLRQGLKAMGEREDVRRLLREHRLELRSILVEQAGRHQPNAKRKTEIYYET